MKIADLCLACYDTPVSPGSRLRCTSCRRMREAPAARRRRRRIAWMLGAAVHLGLLGLAIWVGVRGLPRTGHATPAQVAAANPLPVAAANPSPATPVESSPIAEPASTPLIPPADGEEVEDGPAVPERAPAPTPVVEREKIAPPALVAAPPMPAPLPSRRGTPPSEQELLKQLALAPEFGLPMSVRPGMVLAYSSQYKTAATTNPSSFEFSPVTLLQHYPKASELPIRPAPGCQLTPRDALILGSLAPKLHGYLDHVAPRDETGKRKEPSRLREALRAERRGKRPEWLRPEAVPTMVQILMAEEAPIRLVLVDMLGDIDGKASTVALAQRAVFDLSPDVRKAALAALADRPVEVARPIFVGALRYPWAPAAEQAAEALAALKDVEAAPLLVAQLDKPDPALPFTNHRGTTSVKEVIRLNHKANCMLCHVPALTLRDPVIDIDPTANLLSISGGSGGWGGRPATPGKPTSSPLWVRADVQFLHQDFSVTFPITKQFIGVAGARFDFVIRTRPLTSSELKDWKKQSPPEKTAYPQRDSVLFALKAITGQDAGPTTDAWVKLYPNARAEADAVRLTEVLRKADAEQRSDILVRYRDAKEERFTDALASAIPKVKGNLQAKVREILVERLTRQSADTIRTRMQDEDDEIRRAATLACVKRPDKLLVPDLIALLMAQEPEIAAGAHRMLKQLTNQDFGPTANADEADRVAAAAKWEAWRRGQAAE